SAWEIDPFYITKISFTGYNMPRYSNTLIIYNKPGSTTETNGYRKENHRPTEDAFAAARAGDTFAVDHVRVFDIVE
ncbi:MAG: hypothetical protein J6K03_05365, partial [Oscillospiraceae bacterium]|nr:hypothetical protein [Oscillospiraceae bacterium]